MVQSTNFSQQLTRESFFLDSTLKDLNILKISQEMLLVDYEKMFGRKWPKLKLQRVVHLALCLPWMVKWMDGMQVYCMVTPSIKVAGIHFIHLGGKRLCESKVSCTRLLALETATLTTTPLHLSTCIILNVYQLLFQGYAIRTYMKVFTLYVNM